MLVRELSKVKWCLCVVVSTSQPLNSPSNKTVVIKYPQLPSKPKTNM